MSKIFHQQAEMQEIQEKKEKLLLDASNIVARALIAKSNAGTTNQKEIEDTLNSLLKGFNDEDKLKILTRATCKIIVNI